MLQPVLFLLIISISLSACQQQSDPARSKNSKEENQALLNLLADNMHASITDMTERQREPTNQWLLVSYYPLSAHELAALQSVADQEGSFATGLVDGITCRIVSMQLRDENGVDITLADTSQYPLYVQRFGLWEHEEKLCQNVGIQIRTLAPFSSLTGHIELRLQLEDDAVSVIPVNISINDVL
ncbi:hypothetical protein M8998_03855 [Sphingobacterium sp. lm-10]|uniref:hypothetical protein n=1 Tax=Sphingobacterium sp. lm-10 TaxID=2944904 RepID=UPI0020208A2D|nr:hypothetical protein [Sphingobacterium sp. lm-10]MCL7987073.1 hypothetical protein [Sphingobacterium sp. lm-10]